MRMQRGLTGWHEALQRVHGHAGDIQERRRAGLQARARATSPHGDLLPSEASCPINRDKLKSHEASRMQWGMLVVRHAACSAVASRQA